MKKTVTILGLLAICASAAIAQTYPFFDDFESYGGFGTALKVATTPWNSKNFYVYQPRGSNNSKGAQSGLSSNSRFDSLVSPLIGPISATTQLSFNYRLVEYIGSSPLNTILQPGDAFEVQVTQNDGASYTTVASLNANTTSAYLSQSVNLSAYEGRLIKFRFYGQLNTTANRSVYFHIDDVVVADAVSTNRVADNATLTVYPNPLYSNSLQLNLPDAATGKATVIIADLLGKNMATQTLDITASRTANLPIPSGLSGAYFVTLQTENGRFTQKVIINN